MKKIALITGSSRGIGAETARLLAKEGYAVCVNYLQAEQEAQQLVQEINEQNGQAISIRANMAEESDIMTLFETIDKHFGPITALVNNAGINGQIKDVEQITLSLLQSVFAVNVFGTFIATREAIKRMKVLGAGSIVNITSEAAKFGGTQLTHYAASKAAINTFTIGCAREVAPYHIRINAVSPGVIDTDIHASSTPERLDRLQKSLPMGRMGTTREVAEMISWLLSDKASYISGAILPITGAR